MNSLICLGSLNAKPADRNMGRDDVLPFQVVEAKKPYPFTHVSSLGELGISSLAVLNASIFLCTGNELFEVSEDDFSITQVPIPNMKDVHEISVIDGKLWLANTGANELVCYDPSLKRVSERVALRPLDMDPEARRFIIKYHCNQCFKDNDSNLLAVVHNVDGKQKYMPSRSKRIKRYRVPGALKLQGKGGIINARTGEVMISGLRGPHSARQLKDGSYIVCDSGRFLLCHYDDKWQPIRTVSTKGWSRGVAISKSFMYVGISVTRKRYLSVLPATVHNTVMVFDIDTLKPVDEIRIPSIEQINNVYLMQPQVRKWIQAKHSSPPPGSLMSEPSSRETRYQVNMS